jgi:lysophospholipase L1-like esterase
LSEQRWRIYRDALLKLDIQMTRKQLHKSSLLFLGVLVLFLLPASALAAGCPDEDKLSGSAPLHLLVLGDSIMWGQGLREEEKFSSRVKCWLQEKTDREVKVHVEAHSGAVISGTSSGQPSFTAISGEVNQTSPTINQQLDDAIQFHKENGTSPSLILMNGCINDVGVKNLLAASTPMEVLRAQVRKSCGDDMHALLRRVRNSFPQAQVLVTGYYPIVSLQTADNAFLRLLVKELNNQRPEARRMSDKEMRERLIAISDEWYETSTASLIEAVGTTNAGVSQGKICGDSVWARTCLCRSRYTAVEFHVCFNQRFRLRESYSRAFVWHRRLQSKRSREGKQDKELRTDLSETEGGQGR